MLVQHSVHINRSIEAVRAALETAPEGWLPSLVGPSPSAAGESSADIGLRTKVSIELGAPTTTGLSTEIPITWQASYIGGPFPLMKGKIELAPNEGRSTTLTVYGSYDPPPERIGADLGESLIRQVAEANVKEVAESIARRLDAAAAAY
ncbi:MAG TPA: SRPBCC family protein [Candidatus Acidoferrum sp.]|nr:SRPBCC family protein [Candidatus Acidoferrum sp.]